MSNKVYISVVVFVILIMGFILIDDGDMSIPTKNIVSDKGNNILADIDSNDNIEYTDKIKKKIKTINKLQYKKKKHIVLPKNVKYRTSTRGGRYTVEIIDKSELDIGNGMTIPLSGFIDGNSFMVEIPENLKNYDLKLKVTDRKTKEIKEVALPFTSEMNVNKNNPYMQIEFKDIQNYSMNSTSKKNIFP